MANAAREALTPEERKSFWHSLYWSLAGLAVWPLLVLWVEVGWPVAVWLGAGQDWDWVFHSDVVFVPFFYAFTVGCGFSIARAQPVIRKRPICLVWAAGPLAVTAAWPLIVVLLVRLGVI